MSKYRVLTDSGCVIHGPFEAENEQDARDLFAVDAGYKTEADMIESLQKPSEFVAELVVPYVHEASFEVSINGSVIDSFKAENEQDAIDFCAVHFRFKNAADMEEKAGPNYFYAEREPECFRACDVYSSSPKCECHVPCLR